MAVSLPLAETKGATRVSWIWYWAILDHASDGRTMASIPDLGAYGANEKDAVARVAELAGDHVRALMESGQQVPRARHASEMPNALQAKIGRARFL